MPQSIHSQVMELKEKDHRIIFRPELPLINPETIFSRAIWENILELIDQYLKSIHFQVYPTFAMDFVVRDLYFAKEYDEFDVKRAKKLFSLISTVEGEGLIKVHGFLIKEWYARLYYYRNAVRFAVDDHEESDETLVKSGYFKSKPIRWCTTRDEFLQFIDTTEKALMGQGKPIMCRAFMEVEIPHARIDIRYFYQMPSIIDFPVKTKLPTKIKKFEKQRLKVIPPETTISIFI